MGGLFSIFLKKSASKAPKTCDFAYFTSQWGARAPPWLRYCLGQKASLKPELTPKFLSTLGPNPARTRSEPTQKARSDLQLWYQRIVLTQVRYVKSSSSCKCRYVTYLHVTVRCYI